MEPADMNIEEVLKKWERYHPPPERNATDEKPWYQKPMSEYANINQNRRMRRRIKKGIPDFNVNHCMQKKFRVIPPVIKSGIQNYQISQCNKCQASLQYFPSLPKDIPNSQSLSLFSYLVAKKRLKWYGARFFQSIVLAACYQSIDELLLREVCQKQMPLLLVHNIPGFFSSLLLHLYCACFGKMPFTIMQDIPSPVLKYLMKKVGFIFIEKDVDNNMTIAETIVSILKSNNPVLIGMEESEQSCSLQDRLFPDIFDILRKDDQLIQQILLLPLTLSIETGLHLFTNLSLFGLLKEWLFFPKSNCGLVHFNISRAIKLQSVMSLAAGLNEQESCDEENNLILRHIAYDLNETGAILPTHLLSFLFLTKFRDSVAIDELIDSVEWLINKLRDIGRFIGFSGKTADITSHALNILKYEGLVDINSDIMVILPRTHCYKSLQKLFAKGKKINHVLVSQSILATSIVACLGGHKELTQGSGYNVKCSSHGLLEKAEYLAEILSFLFDYCCPFNKFTEDLVDSLEMLVTMDILHTASDTFENQSHQKLVQSIAVDSVWDDEEDVAGQGEGEVWYDVSVQDDVVQFLCFLSSCILPFIEVIFTVIALIRESGEGKKFSVQSITDVLRKRFEHGLFLYGEMITDNFVSRVFDFLYEKEIIDEYDDLFLLSPSYIPGNGELEKLLAAIGCFR